MRTDLPEPRGTRTYVLAATEAEGNVIYASAREAEAFFHERGADAYVEGYRARAARAKTAATTRTPKGAKQAGSPVS